MVRVVFPEISPFSKRDDSRRDDERWFAKRSVSRGLCLLEEREYSIDSFLSSRQRRSDVCFEQKDVFVFVFVAYEEREWFFPVGIIIIIIITTKEVRTGE